MIQEMEMDTTTTVTTMVTTATVATTEVAISNQPVIDQTALFPLCLFHWFSYTHSSFIDSFLFARGREWQF